MEMKSSESLILSLRRYATSHIYFVFLQKSDDNSRLFVRYFFVPTSFVPEGFSMILGIIVKKKKTNPRDFFLHKTVPQALE